MHEQVYTRKSIQVTTFLLFHIFPQHTHWCILLIQRQPTPSSTFDDGRADVGMLLNARL